MRGVAESSMREVIGRTPIQPALGPLRGQIEADVLKQTQEILDRYKAGVEITQVQLQKVDPPAAVIESFRDVQRANTDAERMRNEAESYRNDIVPRARGDAARIVAEGQGAKAASVAQATGQAQRFDSVLKAYQAAKDVTLRRMYLDTMEDVLSHGQPLVVDDKLKGLVPFLPLNVPPPVPRAAAPPLRRLLRPPWEPADEPDHHRRRRRAGRPGDHRQCQPVHRHADRAGAGRAVRRGRADRSRPPACTPRYRSRRTSSPSTNACWRWNCRARK